MSGEVKTIQIVLKKKKKRKKRKKSRVEMKTPDVVRLRLAAGGGGAPRGGIWRDGKSHVVSSQFRGWHKNRSGDPSRDWNLGGSAV